MGTLAWVKTSRDGRIQVSSSGKHAENAKSTTNTFSSAFLSMMIVAESAEPMLIFCGSPVKQNETNNIHTEQKNVC